MRTLTSFYKRLKEPLAAFLGTLGIYNISFRYAMVPQQEDGCSCGIFTLAGILAHVHNTPFFEFNTGHVSCCHHDLLWSIIECKLIINYSLVYYSPPTLQHVSPVLLGTREDVFDARPQPKLKRSSSSYKILSHAYQA